LFSLKKKINNHKKRKTILKREKTKIKRTYYKNIKKISDKTDLIFSCSQKLSKTFKISNFFEIS